MQLHPGFESIPAQELRYKSNCCFFITVTDKQFITLFFNFVCDFPCVCRSGSMPQYVEYAYDYVFKWVVINVGSVVFWWCFILIFIMILLWFY